MKEEEKIAKKKKSFFLQTKNDNEKKYIYKNIKIYKHYLFLFISFFYVSF